jgi:putative redox protein
MGSCSLWDVVEILRKSRQEVRDLRVHVTTEQQADPPWTFRKVHLHYLFVADALDAAIAERAVRLSVEKYCSVISTVGHAASITDSFEIVRDAAEAGAPVEVGPSA